MKPLFPFFLFTLIILTGCWKRKNTSFDNPYGLPNATQTGANIFACRVDGVNWALKKVRSSTLASSYLRSNNRDSLIISAKCNPDSVAYSISFIIKSKLQENATYSLGDSSKAIATMLRLEAPCGPTSGYGGSQILYAVDGSITISRFSGTYTVPACCTYGEYDANSIIAGTFHLIFPIPGCDTVKITDGRFDINYSAY